MKYKALAREILATGCVRQGTFLLYGGEISSKYVNLRPLRSKTQTLRTLAKTMLWVARDNGCVYDVLADVPTAATPLVTAMSLIGRIPMISPVLERKQRGLALPVLGFYQPGQRGLIIDDVATTGRSICFAVRILRDEGILVEDALVGVDREQGAEAFLQGIGIRLHRVFTLQELLNLNPT